MRQTTRSTPDSKKRLRRHLATHPAHAAVLQGLLILLYAVPIAVGSVQIFMRPFWHIRLPLTTWLIGAAISLLPALFIAWLAEENFRHNYDFKRTTPTLWQQIHAKPSHKAWRTLRYRLFYSFITLCFFSGYSAFFAYNIGRLSLIGIAYYATEAQLHAVGTCSRGRYSSNRWKFLVQLSEPYKEFNGNWCSLIHRTRPAPQGIQRIYLRSSRFAQELRFYPPQ